MKKSSVISIAFLLSLTFTFILMRMDKVSKANEEIYVASLQNNLVSINDCVICLDQIINDYENLVNYELKLNSIAEQITDTGKIFLIISIYDRGKETFLNSRDLEFNTFTELFLKYAQIVRDWSLNINEEKGYDYPTKEDLQGLYNDLNQYLDLFLITEKNNEYYVGGILLKDFDFSYVSKKINRIIDNSYFDEIRGLY